MIFEPPFSGWGDDYRYLTETDGFVEDLPIEWRPRLEELRLVTEGKIQKVPTVQDTLGATETTPLVEVPVPTEVPQPTEGAPGLEELPPVEGNIAKFGIPIRGQQASPSTETEKY